MTFNRRWDFLDYEDDMPTMFLNIPNHCMTHVENIYKITIQNPAFEGRCKNLFFLFTNPLARGEVIEGEFYPHSKIKYKAISSIVTYWLFTGKGGDLKI